MVRVLVWSNEPLLQVILQEAFADEGWSVNVCASLADLEAQSDAADVAVVDGVGTVRALDGAARTYVEQLAGRLAVVLLSGWNWASAELGQELGLVAVIRKPFDLTDVLDAVQQAIGGPRGTTDQRPC